MAAKLLKHGTRAGYDVELTAGNVCERCRKAKAVYQRQYTKAGKAAGLKYRSGDVIDHLYGPGISAATPRQKMTVPRHATTRGRDSQPNRQPVRQATEQIELPADDTTETEGPSVGQRLGDALRKLSGPDTQPYVNVDEMPGYLHTVDPDPEPQDSDSSRVSDDFIISKDGMVLIEQNMGTYLSVIGMTLEMVDPYCGPILAENFDNIVGRWSKVVARYPAAAKFFMSEGGGMIMDWIGAIQATWPVLYALYEHHLAGTVRTDKGRVMRVVGDTKGPDIDATMPQYDYTTR
jgi:hypothetical protein